MARTVKHQNKRSGSSGPLLHEVILKVTRDLLIEKGDPDKVSIAAICDRAECTPPSIYHYYPTKEILLRAASDISFQMLAEHLKQVSASTDNVGEATLLRAHGYLDWGLQNPGEYTVLFRRQDITSPRILSMNEEISEIDLHAILEPDKFQKPKELEGQPINEGLGTLKSDLTACRDAGYLPPDTNIGALALMAWGLLHGLTMLGISNPSVPRKMLHDALGSLETLLSPPSEKWHWDVEQFPKSQLVS